MSTKKAEDLKVIKNPLSRLPQAHFFLTAVELKLRSELACQRTLSLQLS